MFKHILMTLGFLRYKCWNENPN